jgi:hypothetical protein
MAIVRIISAPNALPTVQQDYVDQNNLIETIFLRVPNPKAHAGGNVLKGEVFQVGGTVYLATSDTAITGSQSEYVKLTPNGDGSEVAASYVANLSGVTWNDTYNGYYDVSGNLYVFNDQMLLRKGDHSIVLTEQDTTTVPAIAAGCCVEINGGFYTNFSDIAISGSTSNSTWYDILLTPSGRTFTASFIARGTGTWDDDKQGMYSGNNRVIGCVYRNGSAEYVSKNVFNVVNRSVEIKIDIGGWNMDSTISVSIPHGLAISDVLGANITATVNNDVGSACAPLDSFNSIAGTSEGGVSAATSTIIALDRRTGGSFDSTAFDDDTINRGHIYFNYKV